MPLTARLTPDGACRFLVPVYLGTPAQTVQLMIDTGSHYLLVQEQTHGSCSSAGTPVFGGCYNSSASLTMQDLEGTEAVQFSIDGERRLARRS